MKIIINGINANLRFSSAHVIQGHVSCGFIHGQSYDVDIEIEGERSGKFDFVVDFKDVKSYVGDICDKLDHRLLIPVYNNLIDFKDFNKENKDISNLLNLKTIHFKIQDKGYSIPNEDCVLLPIPYTSAEELSQYFAELLTKKLLESYDNISSVAVCVNEGIGQGALYKKVIVE